MSLSVLIFFAMIFVLVFLLRTLRVGALVAFLVAGMISGPYILDLFQLNSTWTFLGDLGILFLWFTIGLEINIKRLWNMRRTIFGFGATQVLMVAIMLFPDSVWHDNMVGDWHNHDFTFVRDVQYVRRPAITNRP